jgi:hypothetical protein
MADSSASGTQDARAGVLLTHVSVRFIGQTARGDAFR